MTAAKNPEMRPLEWRSKALLAAGRLRELAREVLASGGRSPLPGERELAARLAVSRRTLQQALHILEACAVVRSEHGRGNFPEPEPRWRELPAPGWELLVVAPWGAGEPPAEAYMFREMAAGLDLAVASASARLAELDPAAWEESSRRRGFVERFRGVVLIDPPGAHWAARLLGVSDWRVVVVEHNIRDLAITSVADGSFLGTFDATNALLGLGHRRIAFLDRDDWQQANPAKSDGYLAALEDAGLACGRELFRTVPTSPTPGAVNRVMDELLALPEPPTAVISFRDAAALLVLEWMKARGLEAGKDLSVVGSGDQAHRRGLCRTLSSVRVHYRRMGEVAALEALCGRRRPEMRTVIVPNRLKLRKSAGPAPGTA